VKIGAGLNNVLHGKLPCGLGKVLGGVPGLGGSAEGRARQWRSGGGHGSSGFAEMSVLVGHQARLEAHVWAREELRATGRSRGQARRRAHRRR
jgi:hypothetical protein